MPLQQGRQRPIINFRVIRGRKKLKTYDDADIYIILASSPIPAVCCLPLYIVFTYQQKQRQMTITKWEQWGK